MMTKKEEREIKRGYLNYEKTGQIAKRLNLKNFEVSNYIKQHEKEWRDAKPVMMRKGEKHRCDLCGVIVSNEKPEPGRLYNTQVLSHFIIESNLHFCYDCVIKYFRYTLIDNYGYVVKRLRQNQNQDKLLDFDKYR